MTIKSIFISVPLVLLAWLTVLTTVNVLTDAAPASVVLFPTQAFLDNLPENTTILAATKNSVTVSSEIKGFNAALFQNGAWIVLPAGLAGCLGFAVAS